MEIDIFNSDQLSSLNFLRMASLAYYYPLQRNKSKISYQPLLLNW